MNRIASIALTSSLTAIAAGEGLNFLAVGDWGGISYRPYTTPTQKACADGMAQVAENIDAQFVLALGDNFYHEGIESDATDHRFEDTFESVYSASSLQIPWYVLAGNHDHYGNVSAQIEYSKVSPRWNFPDYNHNHVFEWMEGEESYSLEVIMIDTVNLVGMHQVPESHPLYFAQPPGPKDPLRAEADYAWIEEKLAASTADFVWVAGHFPVYSACQHGNTDELVAKLKPLLDQYGAHYMAGHDHCQFHIADDAMGTQYLLTGAGDICCYPAENRDDIPEGFLKFEVSLGHNPTKAFSGFSSLTATSTGMTFTIYDGKGNVLYTTPSIPPRARSSLGADKRCPPLSTYCNPHIASGETFCCSRSHMCIQGVGCTC